MVEDRALEVKKLCRRSCSVLGKVFLEDIGKRTLWKVQKEKRFLEISHQEILIGGLATTCLSMWLALSVQGYDWTMEQRESTNSEQARDSCKGIVKENGHQRENDRVVS